MSVATLTPGDGASPLEGSIGLGVVGAVLSTLGLPEAVVGRLVHVAATTRDRAQGTLDRQEDDALLDALSAGYALAGQLEATSIEITRALSRRAAERLLGETGCTSPEELGARARQSWRRQTKLAVASELQALLGLGVQESYDMIALANAPDAVRGPVTDGMTARGARWGEARKFWDEAGDLDHEDAADVAEALFGDDPDRVVNERLEPDEDSADDNGDHSADEPADPGGDDAADESEQPDDAGADRTQADSDACGEDGTDGDDADSDGDSDDAGSHADGDDEDTHADGDDADSHADGGSAAGGDFGSDQSGDDAGSRSHRVKDCPWPTRTFARELKREVAARRKEADQHRRARRRCGMSVSLGADGLSSITFTGETVQIMGMAQRVEDVARQVRREGSGSNLDTLRVRTGAMLLMHGTLPELPVNPAPTTDDDVLLDPDQLLTSNDLERIATVLTAQPAVELQIITPLDAIIGTDALDFLRGRHSCTCPDDTAPAAEPHRDSGTAGGGGQEPSAEPPHGQEPSGEQSTGRDASDEQPTGQEPNAEPPRGGQASGQKRSGQQPIGEVLGPQSAFLSAEHLRELLARPRSILRRLVTDPVTGFLVHRESRGYRPDAALKAFVRARDLMCKGVGCTQPAFYADLDHVINYPDGPTSAANLNLDCRREHLVKTYKITKCVMDATGVVTWTTFFGRIYTTHPHDYRQYSPTLAPSRPSTPTSGASDQPHDRGGDQAAATADESAPQNVRDLLLSGRFLRGMRHDEAERLAGRLIYAALAFRSPRSRLRASDDGPWDDSVPEDPHAWLHSVPIRLRHTTSGGQRRNGPPPEQPTPEEILVEEGLAERAEPEPGSPEDHDPWQDLPPF